MVATLTLSVATLIFQHLYKSFAVAFPCQVQPDPMG